MEKKRIKKIRAISDKCVPIRREINEVLYKQMADLFDKFIETTGVQPFPYEVPNTGEEVEVNPRALFKMTVGALHYRGGYPAPRYLSHVRPYFGLTVLRQERLLESIRQKMI